MHTKKGNTGLLIILGLALIAGAAWFWYTRNQPNILGGNSACTQEAMVCPDGSTVGRTGPNCEFAACPTVGSETSENDTVGWKTYRNEEYGFEFRYPAEWKGKMARQDAETESGVWLNYEGKEEAGSFRFPIWISKDDIEAWKPSYSVMAVPEKITVGGYAGKLFNVDGGEGGKMNVVVWEAGGMLFRTEYGVEDYHYGVNFEEVEKLIISVLSTFKFTN